MVENKSKLAFINRQMMKFNRNSKKNLKKCYNMLSMVTIPYRIPVKLQLSS